MASSYDITIKLYQPHVIERITRPVNVNNVPNVLLEVVTLLFQLLAKHSSAALPCKQFVSTCKHMNDSSTRLLYTHIVSFAIINFISLLNTRAKTNYR